MRQPSKITKCKTPHCRNRRRKDGRDCHKCHIRAWRAANPMRAAFRALKDHAAARDILFTITFSEFREFAEQCDYVDLKSNTARGLTVDRIKNTKGYVPGNLQPMTRSENSVKRAKYDQRRMESGFSWMRRAA